MIENISCTNKNRTEYLVMSSTELSADIYERITNLYRTSLELQNNNIIIQKILDKDKNEIQNLNEKIEKLESEIQKMCIQYSTILDLFQKIDTALIENSQSKFIRKLKLWLKPRLGNLNHHLPKKLAIPENYLMMPNLLYLPTISIVTPSYNQGNFIEKTLLSVIDQHYPNLEYIVQDGASTDDTTKILKNYQNALKFWESIPDSGQSNAINLGFKHATGEILAYLNSDDILLPGSLHYIANYFNTHPDIDVIYGHRVLIDEHDQEIGRWILPKHDSEVLTWVDYIPQETLFWRRRIWDTVGAKVDETFRFAMDWDLILKFRDAGAKFARLPRFLGAFRVHSKQKSSEQIDTIGQSEMERIRMRRHRRPVSTAEIYNAIGYYLFKHICLHLLYRLKFLHY